MKMTNTAIAPQMEGVAITARATIKASARLFGFFSDQIYADKFVAIWRELVANGVDSHVAAGTTDKAVEVTLPTTFTPYAKVRDFGTGMSKDFLMGKFMAYTDASTKEHSDDFIGGFGIGSKAPLSYTEQFAIRSYQDGKMGVYSIFKDDEGCPAIAFLSETETDEENGIEISFPIEQTDIQKFRDAAYTTLSYFDPLPVLKNATEQLVAPEYSVRTEMWGFRKGATTSQIVQGGVAYPIEASSVPTRLHEILAFGIDFFVPIGSVGIALSRERLSYDDKTIKTITTLVETVQPKIQEHINKMFESFGTKWEAMSEYGKIVMSRSASTKLIEQLAQFKGEKLERSLTPIMADKVLMAAVSSNTWNKLGNNMWSRSRCNPPFNAWISRVAPRDVQHVLIMDTDKKPILRCRRFLEEMQDHTQGVLIFRKRHLQEGEDFEWKDFIEAIGSPKVTMLSTIEPAVTNRSGISQARLEKIRGYVAPRRTAEFVSTLPATGGYFVRMDTFNIMGITEEEIRSLNKGDKPLYYFNKGDFELVKKLEGWKCAKEALNEQLKTYKRQHPDMKLAHAFKLEAYSVYGSPKGIGYLVKLFDNEKFNCPKRGPLAQAKAIYLKVKDQLSTEHEGKRRLLEVNADKQQVKINALSSEIESKYPELMTVIKGLGHSSQFINICNKLV